MRRLVPLVVLPAIGLGLGAPAPATAAAAGMRPCKGQPGFTCGTLAVPRDRAHPGGPQLHLAFAVQSSAAQRRKPVLVALTGGPGQSGADFGTSFAQSLAPALSRYRLAVVDQRGTGTSGALNCPALQRTAVLTASSPRQVAACAARLGARRAFYGTRDTVEDLEALRLRLRQSKLALMGVSYGTFVAQQYARVHPTRTRALILDSVVGRTIDPYLLDTFAHQPRALREQCAGGACRGVTRDPVADAGRLAAAVEARGVTGTTFDGRGRARRAAYRHGDEVVNLLIAGDLNPYLQAALPGAIAAALAGDPAALLRLRAIAVGGPTRLRELSVGLFYATTCADQSAPYALTQPFADRDTAMLAALAGVDPHRYAPYDAGTVLRGSNALACSRWPQDTVTPPSTAPLPDVPALILGGRVDQRTPLENGAEVAAELPRAQTAFVRGTGHDVLDSDLTGCVTTALSRWVGGRRVGTPCRGRTNAVRVLPRPPRSLAAVDRARGVPGVRGRAVTAVLATAADARVVVLQQLYAGLGGRGGGLHGGWFITRGLESETAPVVLELTRYTYVPGVRVTGALTLEDGTTSGTLRVTGKGISGVLRLRRDGSAAGRLGGRPVRLLRPARRAASAAGVTVASLARMAVPARPPRRLTGVTWQK